MLTSISGLPAFLLYVATATGLVVLYLVVYTFTTTHNELVLIRQNGVAASVALGSSLLGFALPLSSAIVHSQSLLDCTVWGLVAIVMQIAVYWLVRLVVPDLSGRIADGEMAAAAFLGAASLAAGVVNAAAMSS